MVVLRISSIFGQVARSPERIKALISATEGLRSTFKIFSGCRGGMMLMSPKYFCLRMDSALSRIKPKSLDCTWRWARFRTKRALRVKLRSAKLPSVGIILSLPLRAKKGTMGVGLADDRVVYVI